MQNGWASLPLASNEKKILPRCPPNSDQNHDQLQAWQGVERAGWQNGGRIGHGTQAPVRHSHAATSSDASGGLQLLCKSSWPFGATCDDLNGEDHVQQLVSFIRMFNGPVAGPTWPPH